MKTIAILATFTLAAWSFAPADVTPTHSSAPLVYALLDDALEEVPDKECKCKPSSTSAAGSQTTIPCPGGTAGSLFVTTPSKTPGKCDKKPEGGCKKKDGASCSVTVKAELVWPIGCCTGAAMIGPTIGTSDKPCQTGNSSGPDIEQTWTLSAKCNMIENTGVTSDGAFQIWCDTACQAGAPPQTPPTASFQPAMKCGACSKDS